MRRLFDAHFHVLEPAYPVVSNQGYTPPHFPLDEYLAQTRPLGVLGGAVVAASYQGFDSAWLANCLARLGSGWVGVAQVPGDVVDAEIERLAALGVRALRFNLFRGAIADVHALVSLAERAHAVAGWHAEIYADAAALAPHVPRLAKLPQIAIDHLGMTEAGQPALLDLVAAGAKVKATGLGRVQLDVERALVRIAEASPAALVFGTDLPSTRAARPFAPADVDRIERALGPERAARAFWNNALELYRIPGPGPARSGRVGTSLQEETST